MKIVKIASIEKPDVPVSGIFRVFADGFKRARFDASITLDKPDAKSATPVTDAAGNVTDFRNVTVRGYLSTFKNVTISDREGDYVEPGAFTETIPQFMTNPVMLLDHQNNVKHLIGQFTTVRQDDKGLYVEGMLSNCPCNDCACARYKAGEGMLKTMSMGGYFTYGQDGRQITKVNLWEGSLTPVPANPDATFSVRSLTDAEVKKVESELKGGRKTAAE